MSKVVYEEIQAAGALNRVNGMDFKWSLNPYQGCVHGCHYCFARRYHLLRDMSAGDDFTGVISVKTNIPDVLRRELSRSSWKYETVAIGTSTDPYQPIEGKYRLTRRCLQAFADRGSPIGLVTKGTMAVRDADVLADLARTAGCVVCFSVTTLNQDLWRRLEPGTPPPLKRLQAMETLVSRGVPAGVLMSPLVPGITDDPAGLEQVAKAASEHGAGFLGASVLYLKEGTKDHFMSFLKDAYPQLVGAYQRLYPGAYAPKKLQRTLGLRVQRLQANYHIPENWRRDALPPRRFGQLTLTI